MQGKAPDVGAGSDKLNEGLFAVKDDFRVRIFHGFLDCFPVCAEKQAVQTGSDCNHGNRVGSADVVEALCEPFRCLSPAAAAAEL